MNRPFSPRQDTATEPFRFALNISTSEVPEEVRARAAHLMLDTIGVWAASMPLEAASIACETAARLYGTGSDSDAATLMFDGRKVSLPGAGISWSDHEARSVQRVELGDQLVSKLLGGRGELIGPFALVR